MPQLKSIGSFGNVAAEDDAVLSYFLKTEAVDEIQSGKKFLILGRKGSGKTALARYFSQENVSPRVVGANLRDYPWEIHAKRKNSGASDIEAYVSSWRYLMVVKILSMTLRLSGKAISDAERDAIQFLTENYGGVNPSLGDILRPPQLKLKKINFSPTLMGNKLLDISLESDDGVIGPGLDKLSDIILDCAATIAGQRGIVDVSIHFDELDQGLSEVDDQRKKIFIGLVLAARGIKNYGNEKFRLYPVIYMRTDIWDQLKFSDKNKVTQSFSHNIEWNNETLLALIDQRIKIKTDVGSNWNSLDDGAVMRGSQSKWNHIINRTFMRPRDVIQFMNCALEIALKRDPATEKFTNKDIQAARVSYSRYLKQELDDEISPHWPQWDEALQSCSEIATITFSRDQFESAYNRRVSSGNPIVLASDALEKLFEFSVIGYRRSIGAGGSSWVFQYLEPQAGWDRISSLLKVHLGLKEYAKLREERIAGDPGCFFDILEEDGFRAQSK